MSGVYCKIRASHWCPGPNSQFYLSSFQTQGEMIGTRSSLGCVPAGPTCWKGYISPQAPTWRVYDNQLLCTCAQTQTQTYIHKYLNTHMYMHIYTETYTWTGTHRHLCRHTETHTYIHTAPEANTHIETLHEPLPRQSPSHCQRWRWANCLGG